MSLLQSSSSRRGSQESRDYELSRRRRSSASSIEIDMPNVIELPDGTKELNLDLYLPEAEHIDPPNVHIKTTNDNREMLVEVDNKVKSGDGRYIHEFHYERRSTLPPHTETDGLKCVFDSDLNKICITAPIAEPPSGHRFMIPVEHVKEIRHDIKWKTDTEEDDERDRDDFHKQN